MKKLLLLFFFLTLISLTSNLFGQNDVKEFNRCGTVKFMDYQISKDPTIPKRRNSLEAKVQKLISSGKATESTGDVFIIPVVVHIVWNTPNENISDEMVHSQIRVLNEDYRMMLGTNGENNYSVGADTKIMFRLADIDPYGNPTTGITRRQTENTSFGIDNDDIMFDALGGVNAWNTHKYLNIWVGNIEYLGFAPYPGGNPELDGVVILYDAFGFNSPIDFYNLGRSTTHEIGHWLNLIHIWGNGDCSVDDLVDDTPLSDDANYDCPTGHISCNSVDMVENYMDYTDDKCMNIFTRGQAARMTAITLGIRSSLFLNQPFSGVDYHITAKEVSGNESNNPQSLIFGFANNATDDIDLALGEVPIDTVIKTGYFDARFVTPASKPSGTLMDIRPIAVSSTTWELIFQTVSDSSNILFEWDPAQFLDENVILSNASGSININMKTSKEFLLTDPNVNRLFINFGTQIKYNVFTSSEPVTGGITTGSGNYSKNSSVTVTATLNDGWDFVDWTENNIRVSTDSVYSFFITSNINLVANFEEIKEPTVITQISPLDSATNQPTELDFVWNKDQDTMSINNYWFELFVDTLSTSVIIDTTLSDTTKHVSGLDNLTKYYWRVKANGEIGWEKYSPWSMFTTIIDTPIVVELKAPTNNSERNVKPLILIWSKSDLAESYTLQLSTDTDFTTNFIDSSGIIDTSYILNELDNLTKYFWRIKASNIGGTSNWSEVWNFKTLGKPTAVTLIKPIDSAIDQAIELDFVWNKSNDQLNSSKEDSTLSINNYWFELFTDTSASVIIDTTLSDTTKHVSGLDNFTEYYWRVKAKNEIGWGSFTEWSKFTTIIDTPTVVVLSLPQNNSVGLLTPIELKWFATEQTENYNLHVSLDSSFSTTIIDTTGLVDTLFTIQNLDISTAYFWQVNAKNIEGISGWSEVWNFNTLGKPIAPTLVSPENNIELPDSVENITFVWTSVKSADSYTIETSNSELFDSLLVSAYDLIDTSITYSRELLPGTFYWRIAGNNQAGIGEWSEIFAITILTDVELLKNTIPREFVLHQNYPNPFNPSTIIRYEIPEQSNIKIEIFNMLGQSVGIIVNTKKAAGYYENSWNASNLPSGIYLINITANGVDSKEKFRHVKKALLIK